MIMILLIQRVLDLESQVSSKTQLISKLNSELSELKTESVNVDELRRSMRDLQRQLDLARDSDDVTQQKNTELKQTIKNREQQLEVDLTNVHRRRSSVNPRRARHFCPKKIYMKN